MSARTPTFGRSLAHAGLALLAVMALGIVACSGTVSEDAPPPPAAAQPADR